MPKLRWRPTRRDGVCRDRLGGHCCLNASGSIGYNPLRPWQQKWRDVISGLDAIRAAYRQSDLDNEAVRRQVETFFKDCCELADWLREQAGKAEAMDYVKVDRDLKLCDGMAQTAKHHTRAPSGKRDPITARISRVDGGQGPSRDSVVNAQWLNRH